MLSQRFNFLSEYAHFKCFSSFRFVKAMPRPRSTFPTILPRNWSVTKRRVALSSLLVLLDSFQPPFLACMVLPRCVRFTILHLHRVFVLCVLRFGVSRLMLVLILSFHLQAFCSQLACSLHIELQSLGIDVCAVHPSPVASNFYNDLDHKIDILESACKQAVPPEDLPDDIFRSIGCCALRDLGGMAVSSRMGTFFLPYNFFTEVFAAAAPYLPDWKTHNKTRN